MCTSTRMIYILTYRALREFAAGRKSINPIEAMHQMETSVPNSICHHTHDVMMLAQRSFNQRYEKPAIVHEPLVKTRGKDMCGWVLSPTRCNGSSWLNVFDQDEIRRELREYRNRAYAHRVNGFWGPLQRLIAAERRVKSLLPMHTDFSYELWAQSL